MSTVLIYLFARKYILACDKPFWSQIRVRVSSPRAQIVQNKSPACQSTVDDAHDVNGGVERVARIVPLYLSIRRGVESPFTYAVLVVLCSSGLPSLFSLLGGSFAFNNTYTANSLESKRNVHHYPNFRVDPSLPHQTRLPPRRTRKLLLSLKIEQHTV